jgi:hypothetical protein
MPRQFTKPKRLTRGIALSVKRKASSSSSSFFLIIKEATFILYPKSDSNTERAANDAKQSGFYHNGKIGKKRLILPPAPRPSPASSP